MQRHERSANTHTHPTRSPIDSPSGLVTKVYGRERLVFTRQQICDDLLQSIPKLHAALRSTPHTTEWQWRRTSSEQSNVNTFELVGTPPKDNGEDGSDVRHAVAASVELKCHLNEVLSVLVSRKSSDYEATMQALSGSSFEGGELLYRERCRMDGASQALLGVQMAAYRPDWKLRFTPSHLCHPNHPTTQRLCFESLTHRYPDSDRAVHVMKTLPKRIHDQITPQAYRSALRGDVDHLGLAFDIETNGSEGGKMTKVFVHAYVASSVENSDEYSPAMDHLRGRTSPVDLERRGPSVVNPEAKHILELLMHQLSEFERIIGRRRFGFQSFIYFQPSIRGRSQLRTCLVCLKRFTFFRREFFCQICGHLVCGDCSRMYEVEARVGEMRKNRLCINCVVRVDSCTFADEDIIAALGPTVVPLKHSYEWSEIFQSDEFDEDDDVGTNSSASSWHLEDLEEELESKLCSVDTIERFEGLAQLVQVLTKHAKSNCRRTNSATFENVQTQLERYVNRSLCDSQHKFPLGRLQTADLTRDYRYTFDTAKTTYEGHPLPPTPSPARETRRLQHIQMSGILEPQYDRSALDLLAQVAAKRLKCPVGFVSLIDENLFHSVGTYPKRNFGLRTPRVESMCSHTVYVDKPLIIKNAQRDVRFAQLPVVRDHGIRFYAGFPIRAPDGSIVASLCTSDRVPHNNISTVDYAIMQTLAGLASQLVAPANRVRSIPYQPRQRGTSNCRMKLRTRRSRGKEETRIADIPTLRQAGDCGVLQLDTIGSEL